jgi:hypothetical protein
MGRVVKRLGRSDIRPTRAVGLNHVPDEDRVHCCENEERFDDVKPFQVPGVDERDADKEDHENEDCHQPHDHAAVIDG